MNSTVMMAVLSTLTSLLKQSKFTIFILLFTSCISEKDSDPFMKFGVANNANRSKAGITRIPHNWVSTYDTASAILTYSRSQDIGVENISETQTYKSSTSAFHLHKSILLTEEGKIDIGETDHFVCPVSDSSYYGLTYIYTFTDEEMLYYTPRSNCVAIYSLRLSEGSIIKPEEALKYNQEIFISIMEADSILATWGLPPDCS